MLQKMRNSWRATILYTEPPCEWICWLSLMRFEVGISETGYPGLISSPWEHGLRPYLKGDIRCLSRVPWLKEKSLISLSFSIQHMSQFSVILSLSLSEKNRSRDHPTTREEIPVKRTFGLYKRHIKVCEFPLLHPLPNWNGLMTS